MFEKQKTTNLSKEKVEKLKELPKNTVLVSIQYPEGQLYDLQFPRDEKVLTVRLYDTPIHFSSTEEVKSFFPNQEEVKRIINFCLTNRRKDIIVHCAAGISRSAAVCLFLNLVGCWGLKDNFYQTSHPNPFLLKDLLSYYYDNYDELKMTGYKK